MGACGYLPLRSVITRSTIWFDREFRYGSTKMGSHDKIVISRIHKFYQPRGDEWDTRNNLLIPSNGRFRYRSVGIAIAPFVVLDQIGVLSGPLNGIGAVRANLWFFGINKWWVVYRYWNS